MKKLTMFIFTLLFIVSVPLISMSNEGSGEAAHHGTAMHCGMKHMKPGGGMEGRRGGFGHRGHFLLGKLPWFYLKHAKELKLSDDQIASLKKISFELKKDFISKGADVRLRGLELAEILSKPDYKVEDATAKLKEVSDARLVVATAVLQHSTEARDVLTPEQLKSLKDIRRHERCGKSCCKGKKKHMGKEKKEGEK